MYGVIAGKPAYWKDPTNVDWVPNQQLQLIPGERARHSLSPKRWCPAKGRQLFQVNTEFIILPLVGSLELSFINIE